MSETRISLGESLKIDRVEELYRQLKEALTLKLPVVFETESLSGVDAAALQLLYAFKLEADAQGVAVHWPQPSETLMRAAQLLGLGEALKFHQ